MYQKIDKLSDDINSQQFNIIIINSYIHNDRLKDRSITYSMTITLRMNCNV